MARRSRRYSYSELRRLIQWSLKDCPGISGHIEVDGKLNRIGEGIWHDNYWFWIEAANLPLARKQQSYILRILEQREDWQQGPEPFERLTREAETLHVLQKCDFAHPTPEFVCFVQDDGPKPIGMIETALPGHSLDGHKDRSTLRLIARVAAHIHRLDLESFPHLPSSGSRTEQITSHLAEFDEALFVEFSMAKEVRQWITAQRPIDNRPCVLHGDLLPQNLMCGWPTADQHETPIGVVDWEMARIGDPAYDLAIVSRGDRKVLGVRDGLKILIQDYLEFGGQPLSLIDVRLHEFLLLLHWLEESWREYQKPVARGHGPDFYEGKLRSLFRRTAG